MLEWIFLFVGIACGALMAWLLMRTTVATKQATLQGRLDSETRRSDEMQLQLAQKETTANELRLQISKLSEELAATKASREAEAKSAAQQLKLLNEAREKLSETFAALSNKSLEASRQTFFDLAKATFEKYQQGAKSDLDKKQESFKQLVEPIQKSLGQFDQEMRKIEKTREGAYAGLMEQVKHLSESQRLLQNETGHLVRALRSPAVRGRWGEMQLRRTVEMAGMVNRVDFSEQQSAESEQGRQRPDMVIHLPNGRQVVVDSKVTADAYLRSLEAATPEAQKAALVDHARQVRDQIKALGSKSYWEQFEPTPDFVVLFLPLEALFSAALEQEPELIDFGVEQRVILATPTTLIALLKAVGYGWRQEEVAQEARTISALGKELYERIVTLTGHLSKVGRGLDTAVRSYNDAVSSVESRLLVSARKMKELPIGSDKEIAQVEPIERSPRQPTDQNE